MKRLRLTTAAALATFGLLCGCAMNSNTCGGERQGFFSRWFGGGNRSTPCECIETGRVTVGGEGPVVPEPSFGEQSYPITSPPIQSAPFQPAPSVIPTMPNAAPLAQPIPAGPASQLRDARK